MLPADLKASCSDITSARDLFHHVHQGITLDELQTTTNGGGVGGRDDTNLELCHSVFPSPIHH